MIAATRLYNGRQPAAGPKVRDVVDLAVLRVRQSPGSFDPALLFRELERDYRIDIIRRIMVEMPPGWAFGTGAADRFARYVCLLAERAEVATMQSAC